MTTEANFYTVGDMIEALSELDPEAIVVRPSRKGAPDEEGVDVVPIRETQTGVADFGEDDETELRAMVLLS